MLFTTSSCEKQNIEEGDHTFSCYIDGQLFVPDGCETCVPYNDGLHFLIYDNFFSLTTYNKNHDTFYFNIMNWNLGKNNLSDSNGLISPDDPRNINHALIIKNGIKYLSKQGSGQVTFTVKTDTDVKGTFEFNLYNENNLNDVIHVTNGKFDD